MNHILVNAGFSYESFDQMEDFEFEFHFAFEMALRSKGKSKTNNPLTGGI